MSSEKLSNEELALMLNLIKRYAETDMDQFDLIKFDAEYGEVLVSISMSRSKSEEGYSDVTDFMKKHTSE